MKKQFKTKRIAIAAAFSLGASMVSAQSGPIKIGVVTPLSGTYTPIGEQVKMGLDLAAKEINVTGGINGRKIDLIYEDEEANPAVATQKAEKLFLVEKVDFLT